MGETKQHAGAIKRSRSSRQSRSPSSKDSRATNATIAPSAGAFEMDSLLKKMKLPRWILEGRMSPAAPAFIFLTAALLLYAFPHAYAQLKLVRPEYSLWAIYLQAAGCLYCMVVVAELVRQAGSVSLHLLFFCVL
eukprot:SAG31_NODE_2677_length_5265_cov_15.265196_3_plen_135_part_00